MNKIKLVIVFLLIVCFVYADCFADISNGHRILLKRGLQIQASAFTEYNAYWSKSDWQASNFTTINPIWYNTTTMEMYEMKPDSFLWGRWQTPTDNPSAPGSSVLKDFELPYVRTFVSWQYGDEQDMDDLNNRTEAANWMDNVRSQQGYEGIILYTNQAGLTTTALDWNKMRTYIMLAEPDMLSFDSYPFMGSGETPDSLYRPLSQYRSLANVGIDGTSSTPIPFGIYLQTFVNKNDPGNTIVDDYRPSESEINFNQFAALAFGCKFMNAFVYDEHDDASIESLMFTNDYPPQRTTEFNYVANTNRQSRNIGKSLVALLSTDIRIKKGVNSSAGSYITNWTTGIDPYIVSISVTNLGTGNGGQAGDVLIGYFKVLDESFDGSAANEQYFMIVNAIAEPSISGYDGRQKMRLDFNFGTSGITQLQKISRETGEVEVVPLTLSGSQYYLETTLEGGLGDLYKFDTGAVFVTNEPCTMAEDLNKDCIVNFADFSELANMWLDCNDPNSANCD